MFSCNDTYIYVASWLDTHIIKKEHLLVLFILMWGVCNIMQHGFHSCIAWNIHQQTTKLERLWISGRRHAPGRTKYVTGTHFYIAFWTARKAKSEAPPTPKGHVDTNPGGVHIRFLVTAWRNSLKKPKKWTCGHLSPL